MWARRAEVKRLKEASCHGGIERFKITITSFESVISIIFTIFICVIWHFTTYIFLEYTTVLGDKTWRKSVNLFNDTHNRHGSLDACHCILHQFGIKLAFRYINRQSHVAVGVLLGGSATHCKHYLHVQVPYVSVDNKRKSKNKAILSLQVHSRRQSEWINYIDGCRTVSQTDTSGH